MPTTTCSRRVQEGLCTAVLAVVFAAGCSTSVFSGAPATEEPAAGGDPPVLTLDEGEPRKNPLREGAADPIRRPDSAKPESGKAAPAKKAPAPEPAKTGSLRSERPPFDPIKVNGQYFVGWPKPVLALVFTGSTDGYFEPCGCAGLDRMKGGLSRRHAMLEELRRQRGWPVVTLDVGGIIRGWSPQAVIKLHTMVMAMRKMGYDAIALGKNELRFPGDMATYAPSVRGNPSLFVSANVDLIDQTAKMRILQAGGVRLGVTAVLGKKHAAELANVDPVLLKITDAEQALRKVLPALQKAKCGLLILLAHATREESLELAKTFPEFDVVATSGGYAEPPADGPRILGRKTQFIEVGEKGEYAIAIGLFDDPQKPVRYQRVILDSRYKSSLDIVALMESYQSRLKEEGLEGLGVRSMPNSRIELLGKYVGSAKCESCHEESYRVWRKSGHSKAYDTLVKAAPPRNFDPECVSCHVIGWHPTEYRPYVGGFESTEKTPQLINVGCESCHGPGEAHCAAENPGSKADKALQVKLQKAMVVTKEDSEKRFLCASCHDLDNSPDFDFPTYWPKVEHYENKDGQ